MKISYCVSINGQKAVDVGYKFCNGKCYRGIYNHKKRLGQLEVVIDSPGEYKGRPNKWVDISWIENTKTLETVKKLLPKLGFSGCYAIVTKDMQEKDSCILQQEEIENFWIA